MERKQPEKSSLLFSIIKNLRYPKAWNSWEIKVEIGI